MSFNDVMVSIKNILKDNLNDSNLQVTQQLDQELDKLSGEHNKVTQELSSLKDRIIQDYKNTGFKVDPNSEHESDDVLSEDEALDKIFK